MTNSQFGLWKRYFVRPGVLLLYVSLFLTSPSLVLASDLDNSESLTRLSIEDLMDIEVSLVSRRPEKRAVAPAAIYVITREDIEHSPALSVPELLRDVPGLNVARVDASKWSITIRGFSGQLANKLQVLVDGRSIFTPVFSGVTWEDHFMPLDTIERIEVIRGPGGATWGANAVNGIINIITRHAAESQGGALTLAAGTELESMATLSYGGRLASGTHYRAYLHELGMNAAERIVPEAGDDDWRGAMGGVRWDGDFGDDAIMLQFDAMTNRLHDTYKGPLTYRPALRFRANTTRDESLTSVARWTRTLSETSEFEIQTSFHHYESESILLGEWRNAFSMDVQHRFDAGERHSLVWGVGASYYYDHMTPGDFFSITPPRQRYRMYSAFVQDQIHWLDDRLALTAGARAEYSDQAGFNLQPSLRLAWTPSEGSTTWWAAVSRAINNPSRSEKGSRLDVFSIPGIAAAFSGDDQFDSEKLLAYELGVRSRLLEDVVLDVALFYNDYDDYRSLNIGRPRIDFSRRFPTLLLALEPENKAGAIVKGFEITLDWEPVDWWRTRLGWSLLDVQVQRHERGIDPITPRISGDTPNQQLFWQQHFTFSHRVDLDLYLRYTGALDAINVDAYTDLDIRLGWSPRENLALEIVGQNLLDSSRQEYETSILSTVASGSERGVYGSVTWKF